MLYMLYVHDVSVYTCLVYIHVVHAVYIYMLLVYIHVVHAVYVAVHCTCSGLCDVKLGSVAHVAFTSPCPVHVTTPVERTDHLT